MLTFEVVDTMSFLLTAAVQAGAGELTLNMMKAVNSMRCVVTSGGNNFYNILAAVYYFAVEFEFEQEIVKLIDEYYPMVCTCKVETELLASVMEATAESMLVMGSCSEEVQI